MKTRIYSLITLTVFGLGAGIFLFPQTTKAQKFEEFLSSNFYANIRAGDCDVMDPTVGMVTPSTPDDALVYGAPPDRACVPVTAPDGHQLTLGEFKAAQGTARVQCLNKGTLVNVHLSGLIPGGVYTAWLPINFAPPPTAATALGSIAGDDSFRNAFTASARGEGQLTLIQPEGIGTFRPGPIPGCLLGDPDMRAEVHIAYHIDGNTSGGVPGPAPAWVVQERMLLFLP